MKRNIKLITILFIAASWTSSVAALAGSDAIEMSHQDSENIVKIFDFNTLSEDHIDNWWEVSDTVRYRNTIHYNMYILVLIA